MRSATSKATLIRITANESEFGMSFEEFQWKGFALNAIIPLYLSKIKTQSLYAVLLF